MRGIAAATAKEAMNLDPLTDILAIAGAIWFFRHPARHKFLLGWAAAPISWLIQDPSRSFSDLTSLDPVIAGLFLAAMMDDFPIPAPFVSPSPRFSSPWQHSFHLASRVLSPEPHGTRDFISLLLEGLGPSAPWLAL